MESSESRNIGGGGGVDEIRTIDGAAAPVVDPIGQVQWPHGVLHYRHCDQGQEQVDAVCQLRGYGTNQAQIRRRDRAQEFPANPGRQVQLRAPAV